MTTESDRTKARKQRFDAAHADAMESLKEGDYDGLSDAIERETAVIEEQAGAIDQIIPKPAARKTDA